MRVFFAALLPYEVKREISGYVGYLEKRVSGVRWEKEEKLHVTLKFISSAESDMIPDLKNVLHGVSRNFKAVPFNITRLSVLPNIKTPRVVTLSMDQSESLSAVHDFIQESTEKTGIGRDKRSFLPHVTIGRIKSNFSMSEELRAIETIKSTISKIALIRSELTPRGSVYRVLEVCSLDVPCRSA